MSLAAYFVSCVMNMSSDMSCSVSFTEMNTVSKDLITCTKAAATLQDDAVQAVLLLDIKLVVVRKESKCTTPAEAERIAVNEFNKLRSQGVKVDLFKF